MKTYSFNVGVGNTLTIAIFRHKRQLFPAINAVVERFEVGCALNGTPIDMFPNEGKPIDHEIFEFIGKISQDVYNTSGIKIGTKRGADIRSTFFRVVVPRAARAFRAGQLNKRIGQLTDADIASAGTNLRNACTGNFTPPVDLKALFPSASSGTQMNDAALDDAVKFLRDNTVDPIEEGAL